MKRLRLMKSGLRQLVILNVILSSCLVLAADEVSKNETSTIKSSSTTPAPASTVTSTVSSAPSTTTTTVTSSLSPAFNALNLLQLASHPAFKIEAPPTLSDFIRSMMKKYGEARATEAFKSLDQLPLGLIMKVLLVEIDDAMSADIVEMQRYAQSSDKALIMIIGKIVAGDKNVPKEIFAMDSKLMKFGWWIRIREKIFANLERYVAAYSLVPVAAKTALNGATKPVNKVLQASTGGVELPNSELALAVAASATEAYVKPGPASSSSATPPVSQDPILASSSSTLSDQTPSDPDSVSLLNPILQQQQILETLALAKAAAEANAQAQQLLNFQKQNQPQTKQQQQQQTSFNPLAFLLG